MYLASDTTAWLVMNSGQGSMQLQPIKICTRRA